MKTRIYFIASVVLLGLGLHAQVPHLINYQGRIIVGGTNYDGVGQFKFALVNAGGTVNYWSNDGRISGQPDAVVSLPVARGLYSVVLGDQGLTGMTAAIPASVFTNADVRLRVWFNDGSSGFQALLPDQRIAAVGYALVASALDPSRDLNCQRLVVGVGHLISGTNASIAGGAFNIVTNSYAAAGGGYGNIAAGLYSFVGGGYGNLSGGTESVIPGGELNYASGNLSTVGGGWGNIASGYASSIPGGYGNIAKGDFSMAAGAGAFATNYGSFVWADASTTNLMSSTANNQFTARSSGGVRFFSNAGGTVGVQLAPGANAWSFASDRNLKENFKPVDTRAVLEKVANMPVSEWNLISQDPSVRHIGPMAQDFYAALRIGEDDRHISSSDATGVTIAAIQGLHGIVKEKDARIAELEKRIGDLETQMRRLGTLFESSAHAKHTPSESKVKH